MIIVIVYTFYNLKVKKFTEIILFTHTHTHLSYHDNKTPTKSTQYEFFKNWYIYII